MLLYLCNTFIFTCSGGIIGIYGGTTKAVYREGRARGGGEQDMILIIFFS